MREFEGLTGVNFKKVMRMEDALIFVTSPRRVTPYHIDRECNFLLQIRGEKNLYVFDRNDQEDCPSPNSSATGPSITMPASTSRNCKTVQRLTP